MQNFNIEKFKDGYNFYDDDLNHLIAELQQCFNDSQYNFCGLCFCVYKINSYFENRFVDCYEKTTNCTYRKTELFKSFGLNKSTVSRLVQCYERFMTGTDSKAIHLKKDLEGYSSSKLFELLALSQDTIYEYIDQGKLTPKMTVSAIRKLVSNPTETKDTTLDEDDEEIPMAYDPSKHYDFEYFKEQSKNQLLNIIWELQKYTEKLKEKTTKTTNKKQTK